MSSGRERRATEWHTERQVSLTGNARAPGGLPMRQTGIGLKHTTQNVERRLGGAKSNLGPVTNEPGTVGPHGPLHIDADPDQPHRLVSGPAPGPGNPRNGHPDFRANDSSRTGRHLDRYLLTHGTMR